MSTTTAPAEIPVPRDLLPAFRENIVRRLEMLGDHLSHSAMHDKPFEATCDEVGRAVAAHRAFAAEADAYPADAVSFAATQTIEEAESIISDDALSVDEAEALVGRVRACEKLREMAA